MAKEARVIHLQKDLISLGFNDSLRALNWMLSVMNADNGYKRHDGSHYYYHLVDGAQDLLNHGIRKQEVITGYILHDSEEDIEEVTNDLIAREYGAEVALYVGIVTKNPNVDYKENNGKNTEIMLQKILEFAETSLMKASDRKHNFSTLEFATPEKELRQAIETETLFIPFLKEGRKKYPQYSAYFHSAKTTIVPHLNKIKHHHAEINKYKNRVGELERMLRGDVL